MRNHPAARLAAAALAASIVFLAFLPSQALAVGFDRRIEIINTAVSQLGKPYVWAGSGPNNFDCSGLVMFCYDWAGIDVPHQSGIIWSRCDPIAFDRLQPGDLVFNTNSGKYPSSSADIRHVGLYVGGGQVIHAPGTGQYVSYKDASRFVCYGRLKAQYWPRGDTSYDQPPMVRGDFTGDGRDDLGMVAALPNAATKFVVYPSTGSSFGTGKAWWSSPQRGWDWHNTKAAAGDFNGDGKDDLALLYDNGGSQTGAYVFLSGGGSFTKITRWWDSGVGKWSWERSKLVAGDFNGDGKDDLGILYDHDGAVTKVWGLISNGTSFAAPTQLWGSGRWSASTTKIAAGDLNADGKSDIAMAYDYGGDTTKIWVALSNGKTLDLKGTWFVPRAGTWSWERSKMVLADVTGDKKSDAVLMYSLGGTTTRMIILPSTGSALGPVATWWTSTGIGYDWQRAKYAVGDFDHDGVADVGSTYNYGSGQVKTWSFTSNKSGFRSISTWFDSGTNAIDWNQVK